MKAAREAKAYIDSGFKTMDICIFSEKLLNTSHELTAFISFYAKQLRFALHVVVLLRLNCTEEEIP